MRVQQPVRQQHRDGRRLLLLPLLQVSSLLAERERSVYFPAPAPPGSQLHHKLLAAAAGAIMHGQFGAAQVGKEILIHCHHQGDLLLVCQVETAATHTSSGSLQIVLDSHRIGLAGL